MRINYDESDDAIYIRFSEAEYYESDEVKEGVILDFDKDDKFKRILLCPYYQPY